MIPRKYRLRLERDFKQAFKGGKRFYFRDFAVLVNTNEKGYSRFAFIIGKKAVKSAVRRNRIKRRIREACRLQLHLFKDLGYDIVIFCKPSIEHQNFQELQHQITNLASTLANSHDN